MRLALLVTLACGMAFADAREDARKIFQTTKLAFEKDHNKAKARAGFTTAIGLDPGLLAAHYEMAKLMPYGSGSGRREKMQWILEEAVRTGQKDIAAQVPNDIHHAQCVNGYPGETVDLEDVDGPPKLTHRVNPSYPRTERDAGHEGLVVLLVLVDPQGRPYVGCPVRSEGAAMDTAAINAVRKWRFKPAKKDGKPVGVAATIEVLFRLNQ